MFSTVFIPNPRFLVGFRSNLIEQVRPREAPVLHVWDRRLVVEGVDADHLLPMRERFLHQGLGCRQVTLFPGDAGTDFLGEVETIVCPGFDVIRFAFQRSGARRYIANQSERFRSVVFEFGG